MYIVMAHFKMKKDNYLCNWQWQAWTYEFPKSYKTLRKYNKIIFKKHYNGYSLAILEKGFEKHMIKIIILRWLLINVMD